MLYIYIYITDKIEFVVALPLLQLPPLTYSRMSSMSENSTSSPSGYDSQCDTDSCMQRYNIALTEFETGMTYNLDGISVKVFKNDVSIS